MIEQDSFHRMTTELEHLLAQKHGLTSGLFETRLRKALRRAPRKVRAAEERFVQVSVQMGNPKLMRLMDPAVLEADFQLLRAHFRAIDVADRRKGLVLGVLGSVGFSLLAVAALLIIFLVWKGYL